MVFHGGAWYNIVVVLNKTKGIKMKYSYSDGQFDIYRKKDGTRVCVLSNSLEGREMFNKYRKKDANEFWRQKGFNQ